MRFAVGVKRHALWTLPGQIGLRALFPLLAPTEPLDFLHVHFGTNKFIAQDTIAPWWVSSWKAWCGATWPVTLQNLDASQWPARIWSAPIWLNSSPIFHVRRGPRTTGLLVVPPGELSFRLRFGSTFHIRSLADIHAQVGVWPDIYQFIDTYRAALSWGRSCDCMRWVVRLHDDLSNIHARFPTRLHTASPTQYPHPVVGIAAQDRLAFFPDLTPDQLRRATSPPEVTKPHPVTALLSNLDQGEAQRTLRFGKSQRRWLLPVYHDVFTRLLFRILPVGSRFFFLQNQHTGIIMCPRRGCNHVETYEHLLLRCELAKAVWDRIWCDWQPMLLDDLSLSTLVKVPLTTPNLTEDESTAFCTLWHVMRVLVIRALWVDRNRVAFEGARPRRPTSILMEVHVLFTAHYRAILRHGDEALQPAYQRILSTLLSAPTFGSLLASRQELLMIRRRVQPVGGLSTT